MDNNNTIFNIDVGNSLTTPPTVNGTGAATATIDLCAAHIKNGISLAAGAANASMVLRLFTTK
ncbi:hypothetical protein [Pseudomonas sp. ML2-2023-6]|uniref:hypothetical protein n=1 Tax=Pseudomonas sp. ML2-2023-6 TaxID=3122376 RepID=UPI0030CF279B